MSVPSRVYLTRRSNGFYYVVYWHEGRRRWKTTHAHTKREALQAVRDLERTLRQRSTPKPLSIFIVEFLEFASSSFRPSTLDLYRRTFAIFQKLHGDISLSSLTPRHIDAYKAARVREASPVTTNMELRALKAALATAVRWNLLAENPFQGVKQISRPDSPPVFLSRRDFQKLLDVLEQGWLRDLIVFAVATGMRRGEMLNLRWENVDLTRRVVHIHSSATFRTKSGRRRSIPLNDAACVILVSKAGQHPDEFVFTRHGQAIRANYLQQQFKRAIRKAKLDDRLHWHSLRHTHASWLVQAGVSLYEVQKLLGHSSPAVTEVYSHLQPETLHERVNRLSLTN